MALNHRKRADRATFKSVAHSISRPIFPLLSAIKRELQKRETDRDIDRVRSLIEELLDNFEEKVWKPVKTEFPIQLNEDASFLLSRVKDTLEIIEGLAYPGAEYFDSYEDVLTDNVDYAAEDLLDFRDYLFKLAKRKKLEGSTKVADRELDPYTAGGVVQAIGDISSWLKSAAKELKKKRPNRERVHTFIHSALKDVESRVEYPLISSFPAEVHDEVNYDITDTLSILEDASGMAEDQEIFEEAGPRRLIRYMREALDNLARVGLFLQEKAKRSGSSRTAQAKWYRGKQ